MNKFLMAVVKEMKKDPILSHEQILDILQSKEEVLAFLSTDEFNKAFTKFTSQANQTDFYTLSRLKEKGGKTLKQKTNARNQLI